MVVKLETGGRIDRDALAKALVDLQYRRNDTAFQRGTFRLRGETVDIFPSHYEDRAWRVTLFGDEIEAIHEFDPLTGEKTAELNEITVYANSHYVTPRPTLTQAIRDIKVELKQRLEELTAEGKLLEVERLQQRTTFDIEMMETTGSCKGIENYSRYLTGRNPGEPPPTLFEYLPENALLIVDESHVTVPQIGGMYRGDFDAQVDPGGVRLPPAVLRRQPAAEVRGVGDAIRPLTIFVSATPGPWEMERTAGVFAEQVIRPTGLIDPVTEVRPVEHQVDDLLAECRAVRRAGRARAGHHADQAHGGGSHRVPDRARREGALPALRHRHAGADRDHPRPAARRVRRAGRHQPAARGTGHSGMRAGGDPGRRQGGLPAVADLADPDHRPRGAQHRRSRHPVRRHDDQQPAPRDRGDRAAPQQAARLERGARHHAGVDQAARSARCWRACSSRTT